MKKYWSVILLWFLLGLIHEGFAQKTKQTLLTIQAGVGIPVSDFSELAKTGYGITFDAKQFVVQRLALGGQIGYFNLEGVLPLSDDSTERALSHHLFPILATAGYYFGGEKMLLGAGLGIGFCRFGATKTVDGESFSTSAFKSCVAPHLQGLLHLSPRFSLSVTGSYYMIFGDLVNLRYLSATAGISWRL